MYQLYIFKSSLNILLSINISSVYVWSYSPRDTPAVYALRFAFVIDRVGRVSVVFM